MLSITHRSAFVNYASLFIYKSTSAGFTEAQSCV